MDSSSFLCSNLSFLFMTILVYFFSAVPHVSGNKCRRCSYWNPVNTFDWTISLHNCQWKQKTCHVVHNYGFGWSCSIQAIVQSIWNHYCLLLSVWLFCSYTVCSFVIMHVDNKLYISLFLLSARLLTFCLVCYLVSEIPESAIKILELKKYNVLNSWIFCQDVFTCTRLQFCFGKFIDTAILI